MPPAGRTWSDMHSQGVGLGVPGIPDGERFLTVEEVPSIFKGRVWDLSSNPGLLDTLHQIVPIFSGRR